jgi:predicted TIM-barrel fold metal-dependent hydrolase
MDMVDTHPHVIASDHDKYPFAPIVGIQSGWSKERPITTEQFVEYMDGAGVQQAVLVQASTAHGYDNSYAADSVAKYPGRFEGVCCVDAAAPDGAEKLRYWIQDRGMSGVRLFTAGSTMTETDWLDKPDAHPFWLEAARLDVPVAVQVRRTGLSMLVNVLKRYPNVRMLLDHFAHPLIDDGPPYPRAKEFFDLAQYPNLWLKFSTRNIWEANEGKSTVKEFFGRVVDTFGANRLMWGSNFPGTWGKGPAGPYKELADLARDELKVVGEENQRWLLAETARQVYPKLVTRKK